MGEIKIGEGKIPKLIEPIKKIESSVSMNNEKNPNQEKQQKPKESGKGDNFDVSI